MGRPILYSGDPDAPHLTSAERRCIKRRAANRKSARRVRTRRQDTLDGMTVNLRNLEEENKQLSQRASSLDEAHAAQTAQHAGLRQHLHLANQKNYALKRGVFSLRSIVHVRALPQALCPASDTSACLSPEKTNEMLSSCVFQNLQFLSARLRLRSMQYAGDVRSAISGGRMQPCKV